MSDPNRLPQTDRPIFLRSIDVSGGASSYSQKQLFAELEAQVLPMPGSGPILEKAAKIYDGAAVDARHLEFELGDLSERRRAVGWQQTLNDSILSMGHRLLEKVIADGTPASELDALIVVTTNYEGFP